MIDINTLTLEAAKALAFDERLKIDIAQQNLQALVQIINQKSATEIKQEPAG